MRVHRWFVITALALCACKGDPKKAEPAPAPAPTPTPTGGAIDAAAEAPRPASGISEAEAKALVEAWLTAQNSGNLAAYDALYAQRMEGIKRVGPRTWRFDRKGWIADRSRMFKNKMVVEAADVEVHTDGGTSVELTQTYSQGKFRDVGKKQLVLVTEGGAPRIAREEMMKSELQPAQAVSAPGVHMVMAIDGKPYVVIQTEVDDGWASSPPRGPLSSDGPEYIALRDAGKAPAAQAAWQGKTIALYDAKGDSCQGTVTALALAGGGTPHFGQVAIWEGRESEGDEKPVKWSDAQKADAVYHQSEPQLVGALTVPAGCKPVAAIEAAKPTLFKPASDGALEDRAEAAVRALPAFKKLQASFKNDYDGKGDWGEAKASVFASGDRRYVSVAAEHDGDGCGDFSAHLWALYQVDATGALQLINDPEDDAYHPQLILDSDGDGRIEIVASLIWPGVYAAVLAQGATGAVSAAARLEFPFRDCGC